MKLQHIHLCLFTTEKLTCKNRPFRQQILKSRLYINFPIFCFGKLSSNCFCGIEVSDLGRYVIGIQKVAKFVSALCILLKMHCWIPLKPIIPPSGGTEGNIQENIQELFIHYSINTVCVTVLFY